MKTRVLVWVALCAAILPVCLCAQSRPANVVIIVADDMGYADVGFHGSTEIPTPNIDSLARSGIRFTDAYVTGPFCSPTRAGLLTGKYPQRFGHEFNIGAATPEHRDVGLPLSEVTIADRMKAAGYRTALVGKWHLGSAPRFHPQQRGFDEFFGFLHGSHGYFGSPPANPILDGNERVPTVPYLTEAFAERAVDFITRNAARPFFLYLAFNAPHVPMHASEKYLARFPNIQNSTRRTYAAMVSAMDDGVGRVMAALRENALDRNTLVVFFSDNGGPLGENTWNGSSNEPLRGAKGQTYEGGVRVPFIVRWTGRLPAGKTDSRPIIQLDVAPTALAAAGVAPRLDWGFDGVNLLPYLEGSAPGTPHDALFWRTGARMAVRQGDYKLVKDVEGDGREDSDQLTLAGAQLFNVRTDISERTDLAARSAERVKALSDTWQRWNSKLVSPAWPPTQGGRGAIAPCTSRPLTDPAAAYVGTWSGSIFAPMSDSAMVTFTWVQQPGDTGSFTFAREATSSPTTTVTVSNDSLVFDLQHAIRAPNQGVDSGMARVVVSACGDALNGYILLRGRGAGGQRARIVGQKQ
jgi:arylsulfatase A-like enzyme